MFVINSEPLAEKIEADIKAGMPVDAAFLQTYGWGIDSGTAYRITAYLLQSPVKKQFLRYAKKELRIFKDLWERSH